MGNRDARFLLSRMDGAGASRWYQHDARGNVTFRAGFSHVFDALNRLTQTPGKGRFEHDGHGRQTLTWRAGLSPKIDYYDRAGLLRYTTDAVPGGGINYIYLGRTLVAQDAAPWGRSWGITFMHTDAQGTPIAKTDGTGAVVERTRRWSYGDSLGAPVVEGLGFTAHMEDPAQALVYMQQRYYDPKIGRFLSVDPVGPLANASGHFGRYHYALNNPYRFIDPDGRCSGSRIKNRDGTCASTGGSTTRSTGEWLDERAEASAVAGRDAATFGYAFAGVLWDFLGSEKLSQWAAGQGTDPGGIGLELLAVTPVGKIAGGVGAAGRATGSILQTTRDAARAAESLGFKKINARVAGEAVFRRGNDYITRDRTGHNGGVWKMADSVEGLARKETRSGTYDENLNRIGD